MKEVVYVQTPINELERIYTEKYGNKPSTTPECVDRLCKVYNKIMRSSRLTIFEIDGLGDYYRRIENVGEPAYYWLMEAMHITSRKNESKRNFNYFIVIIKNWLTFGYLQQGSSDTNDCLSFFEEAVKVNFPRVLLPKFIELIRSHGVVKTTRTIMKLTEWERPLPESQKQRAEEFLLLLEMMLKSNSIKSVSRNQNTQYISNFTDIKELEDKTSTMSVETSEQVASTSEIGTSNQIPREPYKIKSGEETVSEFLQNANYPASSNLNNSPQVGGRSKGTKTKDSPHKNKVKEASKTLSDSVITPRIVEEAKLIELHLQEKIELPRSEIVEYLISLGVDVGNKASYLFRKYLQAVPNITQSEKRGCYKLKNYKI